MAARVHLVNGWTLSISSDTPPALCSVAAWPTRFGDAPRDPALWFNFARQGDRIEGVHVCDRRCHDVEDILEAIAMIQAANQDEAGDHKSKLSDALRDAARLAG